MAFKEGLGIFKDTLTKDPEKQQLADELMAQGTIQDVVEVVVKAKTQYEDERGASKMHESLTAFSNRLMHHGNIMDALVSHHPKHVALVWGAMKLIFGVSVIFNQVSRNYDPLNSIGRGRTRTYGLGRCYGSLRCLQLTP